MQARLIRQDLAWAGLILLLAAIFGVLQERQLVRLSLTGGLPAYLEQQRQERRRKEFQGVKTISLPQAYEIFQQGQALFVDARGTDEYVELHISGAINLPMERLEREGLVALGGIPRDRRIVVYCGEASCNKGLQVAEKLQTLGFTRAMAFMDGFRAWDAAGFPAETEK